jgi:hypothetical protein
VTNLRDFAEPPLGVTLRLWAAKVDSLRRLQIGTCRIIFPVEELPVNERLNVDFHAATYSFMETVLLDLENSKQQAILEQILPFYRANGRTPGSAHHTAKLRDACNANDADDTRNI